MWIPYQDAVVVVTNDREEEAGIHHTVLPKVLSARETSERKKYQYEPLTELLLKKSRIFSKEQVQDMGFGELRDQLLAIDPLNLEHVKLCNKAEAEFWRRSQGRQVKPSDELLQFDCGGQQWVWEVCFPTGYYDDNNGNDMKFMEDLLQEIEQHGGIIAAHAPIEQRWSASSSSLLSPAYSTRTDGLHCWVGIIMYLPTSDERQCEDISRAFQHDYCNLMKRVGEKVNAASHWAKLEIPNSPEGVHELQRHIRSRYPVDFFNFARTALDPTHLLSNDLIDAIFGCPADVAVLLSPSRRLNGEK
jgi:L-galactono-1,4-lactone dehydrogenase